MTEYRIALDAMGGDNAPDAVVEGALMAVREIADIRVALYGPEARLRDMTKDADAATLARVEFANAPDVITMDDSPMLAVRQKKDSSMVLAAEALRAGEVDAFVSAGSTGAVVACGMMRVGRVPGIDRPALAVTFPGVEKAFLIVDSGANVDCQPAWILQFGLMGAAYMKAVFGLSDPEVRLLNIGIEEKKGNHVSQEAHKLMAAQTAYRFGGNIEARDVPFGKADVVACDGFDGNVIIKNTEGLAAAMIAMMKQELSADARSMLGGMLVKPALKKFKSRLDAERYGGAPLLGVNGAMVKAHGNSSALAIKNAVRQAADMARGDVTGKIRAGIAGLKAQA